MENQAELAAPFRDRSLAEGSSRIRFLLFALAVSATVLLAGCSGGPPTPPPPENPAQVKADIKAREEFARDLPKPPER